MRPVAVCNELSGVNEIMKSHLVPMSDVLSTDIRESRINNMPWLDVDFRARSGKHLEERRGCGLYGIFFNPPGKESDDQLIYLGKYLGLKNDPFEGDVVKNRWWAHVATISFRGRRNSIAPATLQVLMESENLPEQLYNGLAGADALIHKDRGCGAGLNRVKFAISHWDFFKDASPEEILRAFSAVYIQVEPEDCVTSLDQIRGSVSEAEKAQINELGPVCNAGPAGLAVQKVVDRENFTRTVVAALQDKL